MSKRVWFDFLKLAVGFVLICVLFSNLPDYLPESWAERIAIETNDLTLSVQDEEKLGEYIMENLLDEFQLLENPTTDSAIQEIVNRFEPIISNSPYEYNIMVVKHDQINAITLPGGNIILFSGLIEFAQSPEEVAAVLAHEIGHVEERHIVNKLLAEIGLTLVMTIVTGGDATIIHTAASTLLSNVFSRSQEAEADQTGMKLLVQAQIHPKALGSFFNHLNEQDLDYNENLEWMMTHPHNSNRIEESESFPIPSDFKPIPLEANWTRVRQAI